MNGPFLNGSASDAYEKWRYEPRYMDAEAELLQEGCTGRAIIHPMQKAALDHEMGRFLRKEKARNVFADVMIFLFMLAFLGVLVAGILKNLAGGG